MPPRAANATRPESPEAQGRWQEPGPARAPGWTSRSVTTPSNGALICRYASKSFCARTTASAARTLCCLDLIRACRRIDLFLRLNQFVCRDGSGRFGSLLQAVRCALGRGQLRYRLQALRFDGLNLRLSFGDLRLHFRSRQFRQQSPRFTTLPRSTSMRSTYPRTLA